MTTKNKPIQIYIKILYTFVRQLLSHSSVLKTCILQNKLLYCQNEENGNKLISVHPQTFAFTC